MKNACPTLICLSATAFPKRPATAACAEDDTGEPHYITIETRTSEARIGVAFDLIMEHCLPDTPPDLFKAFASGTRVEGCTGLSRPDGWDQLLHILLTDNRRWPSHGR